MTTQGGRTRWVHRFSEFRTGFLVRQRNGTWRLTQERVCGGNCGPRNGVPHEHRDTDTMTAQEAANLLVDWGHDLEEAEGLADYC